MCPVNGMLRRYEWSATPDPDEAGWAVVRLRSPTFTPDRVHFPSRTHVGEDAAGQLYRFALATLRGTAWATGKPDARVTAPHDVTFPCAPDGLRFVREGVTASGDAGYHVRIDGVPPGWQGHWVGRTAARYRLDFAPWLLRRCAAWTLIPIPHPGET